MFLADWGKRSASRTSVDYKRFNAEPPPPPPKPKRHKGVFTIRPRPDQICDIEQKYQPLTTSFISTASTEFVYTHIHTNKEANYRSDPNAETTISVTLPKENHVEPVRPSKHISFIDSGYYSPR